MNESIDKSKLSNKDKVVLDQLDTKQSEKILDDIINKVLSYFKKCGFKEKDNRHYNLSMIFQTLIYVKFQNEKYLEEVNIGGNTIQKYLKGLGTRNLYGFLDQFYILNRASFSTLFNFQFEMIFKGIIEELKLTPKKEEYYWIVKALTDEIYSDETTRTKNRRILNTMAQIRNSLHHGGIHNSKYEFEIEINEKIYKFESGVRFNRASWQDLFHISDAMLDILIEILSSKKVSSIDFIPKK